MALGPWLAPGAFPRPQAARFCPVIGREPGTQLEAVMEESTGEGHPRFCQRAKNTPLTFIRLA